MAWYDLAGTVGVGLIVVAYLMMQLERTSGTDYGYLLANAIGASLILLSLAFAFNFSAMLMEAIWLLISLFGLWRRMSGPRAT